MPYPLDRFAKARQEELLRTAGLGRERYDVEQPHVQTTEAGIVKRILDWFTRSKEIRPANLSEPYKGSQRTVFGQE